MRKIFFCMAVIMMMSSNNVGASPETLSGRLDGIVKGAETDGEVVGISVVSLTRGDGIFHYNDNVALNPASCTKVITTGAALKLLGPDFKFHTKFYTNAGPNAGRIGTLWVKGYGDPTIVLERLWRMARDISNAGVKRIDGDIIIDDFYFEDYKYPGFTDGSGRAFNSLTGAASLNYNTVTVIATPAAYMGGIPSVVTDTAGPYFRIVNEAKTSEKGSPNTLKITKSSTELEDVISVSGQMPIDSAQQYMYGNISNPAEYFGTALKSLLEQNGITVGGKVAHGHYAGGGQLLLDSESRPLAQIVIDMNKYSNNFIAEQIVKTLGAEVGGIAGTTASGLKVIKNYLGHIGISEDKYRLINGSGLTQENRITPAAMMTVLSDIYDDPRIGPEAISSFSVAGVDGTIKDRHNNEKLKGLVRAKTGSLSGVSAIAGVIPAGNGEMLGYTILMNGKNLNAANSQKVQDELLMSMVTFTR